ncbi:Ger(x)C family spore germination protein [Bacillus salipaludis]|uniref:Ger(X)C family spore germination protein n=1 Tax=Bacillus salipaludis TaxID=2547811 RepID=A0AA90QVJ1_9BACI|nr:Ger(x)C family spore germination protein [Bacillus salipaludis]MDQ6597424.1 Ger(x)C family spore germination protein [Bacillus salipaludis]
MKKFLIIFLLIILFLPIVSACWNQKELTDLAFVMALGIDRGENQKFEFSVQIVNPGNVSSGQNGGGQGLPIVVYKSSGNTLTEAARKLTKQISRRLYYAHTNLVVVGEEVAKTDLLDLLDALDRDPEFRTTTELVVARNVKAEDMISTLSLLDKLPVNKITKEINTTEKLLGENMHVPIDDFLAALVSKGKQPLANGIRLIGDTENVGKSDILQKTKADGIPAAAGLALFKRGKLTGWVDQKNARGVVWVLNKVQSTDINVSWNGKKDALSVAPIRSKTKVTPSMKNGKPLINVFIENEGWISEANTAIDLSNPEVINKIDQLVQNEIQKEVLAAIKAVQRKKSDVFGFGETIHRTYPLYWKKIKTDWDNQFAELDVNVQVASYVRREGIRVNPFWVDLTK